MFINRQDKFDDIDNQIDVLEQEKLHFQKRITEIVETIKNKKDERRNYGIQRYKSKDFRENLLNEALQYGYSEKKINELKQYIEYWNQDNVTNSVIDRFRMVEEFVDQNREPYKNSFLYKVSKTFDGGSKNDN